MKRIAMWSGPRNISTALMRSWENRDDTLVVDEPFYGFYLTSTGITHPGGEEVVNTMETRWRVVADDLLQREDDNATVFYQKHMAHHMLAEVELGWLESMQHAFLIRDPSEMIPSLHEKLHDFDVEATGLPLQLTLFEHLKAQGRVSPVLDARAVLEDPRGQLECLCTHLGVPFTEDMLRWPAGRRHTDGIWAPYWYANVEKSTGFQAYVPKKRVIPEHLRGVFDEAMQLYQTLYRHRLDAS